MSSTVNAALYIWYNKLYAILFFFPTFISLFFIFIFIVFKDRHHLLTRDWFMLA